jgi:S1-C subfamily serine protease
LRIIATNLALITATCAALAACAAETPAASPPPILFPPPLAGRPLLEPAQSQEDRERYVIRALSPHVPSGVEGMRRIGSGSGFFIAADRVVTNFHVVDNCRALTVGNNTEGEEVDATVIATDPRADLAVLAAEEKDIQPAQFLTGPFIETREDLAIVGYPEHGLVVLQAELHRVAVFQDDLEKGGTRYNFFGPVRRGNSGGPLLDTHGAVVGVVTAKIDTVAVYQKTGEVVDDLGIAIANHTVIDFLTKNQIAFTPASADTNLSSDDLLRKAHGFVRQIGCWR